MPSSRLVLVVTSLLFTACGSITRYNLQHARIAPGTRLSQHEIEQIITTVSRRSFQTIIGLRRDGDEVTVYTAGDEYQPVIGWSLKKSANGIWRITKFAGGHIYAL
jgi:UDP-glucose 4-epimerase